MRLLEIRSSRHAGEALSTVTSPLQHFNITPWSNPCQSLLAWTHVIGDSNDPQGVSFCSSVPHQPHALVPGHEELLGVGSVPVDRAHCPQQPMPTSEFQELRSSTSLLKPLLIHEFEKMYTLCAVCTDIYKYSTYWFGTLIKYHLLFISTL